MLGKQDTAAKVNAETKPTQENPIKEALKVIGNGTTVTGFIRSTS